jgi:integrase
MPKIDTKTARRRLPHRREPYYSTVSPGRAIGYRIFEGEVGHWLARSRSASGKYVYKPLGTDRELDYEQALKVAQEWFLEKDADDGEDRRPVTVEATCEAYVDYLERHGKPSTVKAVRSRIKNHILPKLGRLDLSELTARRVRDWHQGLVRKTSDQDGRRASQDSANKCLVILKAACTRAAFGKTGIDTMAWTSVKPFQNVSVSRAVFWSRAEIDRLINCCHDADLRDLVLVGWLTGARLGEIAQAEARDYREEVWHLREGKTGPRDVMLTDEAVALFERRTAGRGKRDLVFTRSDGVRWDKDNVQKPLAEALERAKLEGTYYALRHSHCSFALKHGVPVKTLSDNVGTGIRMIEKHYGHVLQEDRRAAFAAAGFGGAVESNLTKIERVG